MSDQEQREHSAPAETPADATTSTDKVTNGSGKPAGATVLSLDDIVQVDDVRYDYVTVPEWSKPNQPAVVRIGSLNAEDLIEFVESNEGPAKRTAGLRLIIQSLVDEQGKRVGRPEHLQALKKKDAKACNRIVEAILKLNGIETRAQAAAKNASSEADSAASPTVLH
jgi:hypothetical protein